jgi:hypothetical protein
MRYVALLMIAASISGWSQTAPTGAAITKGSCSPAVTGNGNSFIIKCGIDPIEGEKMVEILNKILQNQLDPSAVMTKLKEIQKALPAPRRELSNTQVKDFASKLIGIKSNITVMGAGTTDDITPLLFRICQAANSAEWGCMPQEYGNIQVSHEGMPVNSSSKGIKCYFYDWTRDDAVHIKAAMEAAHLNCEYITGFYKLAGVTFTNEGTITIVIGIPFP